VSAENPCAVADQFDATMVWMDSAQGLVGRSYWLLLNGNRANGALTEIKHTYNVNNLEHLPAQALNLNDIARVEISLDRSVAFEAYHHNRSLGSFVLVDRYTHATVAAGMINFALRRAGQHSPSAQCCRSPGALALAGSPRQSGVVYRSEWLG
jgi:bifunctional enzyme CysN/CysC